MVYLSGLTQWQSGYARRACNSRYVGSTPTWVFFWGWHGCSAWLPTRVLSVRSRASPYPPQKTLEINKLSDSAYYVSTPTLTIIAICYYPSNITKCINLLNSINYAPTDATLNCFLTYIFAMYNQHLWWFNVG